MKKSLLALLLCLPLGMLPLKASSQSPEGFLVTYEAMDGGSLSIYDTDFNEVKSGDRVDAGTQLIIYNTPPEGMLIDYYLVNDSKISDIAYSPTVSEDLHIVAYYRPAPVLYSINLTSDQFGYLEGFYKDSEGWNKYFDGLNDIPEGTELTITATPRPNYTIDKWYKNDVVITPSESEFEHKITVTEDAHYHVTFKVGESGSVVTYGADEGGKISKAVAWTGSGEEPFKSGARIADGTEVEFHAESDEGYTVDTWIINNIPDDQFKGQFIAKMKVEGPLDVRVRFTAVAPSSFPIEFGCDEGGTVWAKYTDQNGTDVYPKSGAEVLADTEVKFWVNLHDGYELKEWLVNGESREDLAGKTEFTLTIDETTSVKAVCQKQEPLPESFLIEFGCDEGGTVSARYTEDDGNEVSLNSGDEVLEGTEVKFGINLHDGYELKEWLVNGESREDLAGKTEFTLAIDEATSVKAVCKKKTAISKVPAKPLRVYIADNKLFIEGLSTSCDLSVYDATGRLCLKTMSTGEALGIGHLAKGLYFVQLQGQTYKVIK